MNPLEVRRDILRNSCVNKSKCAVVGCMKSYTDISFFTIPKTDPKRRDVFLKFTGDPLLCAKVGTTSKVNSKICRNHFEEKYILRKGTSLILARTAIPTLNGPQSDINLNRQRRDSLSEPLPLQTEPCSLTTPTNEENNITEVPTDIANNGKAKLIIQTSLENCSTNSELLNNDVPENKRLLTLIASQKEIIETLKKESLEKDKEIISLKLKLDKLFEIVVHDKRIKF